LAKSTSGTVKAWPGGRAVRAALGAVGPGEVGVHRLGHGRSRIGDEGRGEAGVERDQVQREAGDRGGAVGVGLERGPGGGGLQVFVARDPDGAQLRRGLAHLDGVHMRLIPGKAGVEIGDQRSFLFAVIAALRHRLAEFGAAELGDAADEIAQHIGEVLVHVLLEGLPGELAVGGLGRVDSSHQRQ
jgi:hypothetical protein